MVSLKLKGPRRPPSSGRTSSRSKPAAAPLPEDEDVDMDDEDTITVHRSPSPVRPETPAKPLKIGDPESRTKRSRSSAGKHVGAHEDKAVSPAITTAAAESIPPSPNNDKGQRKGTVIDVTSKFTSPTSRPPSSKGKAAARDVKAANADVEMAGADDDDDNVEEYDFSNEPETDEDDYNDDGLDTEMYKKSNQITNGVITISSDDEPRERFSALSGRPWREMNRAARYEWESMYCKDIQWAMNGDWGLSEDVLAERDKEMMKYLEDFPHTEWVIPRAAAIEACSHLEQRFRWRKLGIPIYDQQLRMQSAQRGMYQHLAGLPIGMPTMSMYPNGIPLSHPQGPNGLPAHSQQHYMPHPAPNGVQYPPASSRPNGTHATHSATTASSNVGHALSKAPAAMPPPPSSNDVEFVKKSKKRKSRSEQTTPMEDTEPSHGPASVPPYPTRPRPQEREPPTKGRRRHAEAKSFPWNRQINFPQALANATWDDSIYDKVTLDNMEIIRQHNEPIIERIESEEAARQGRSRLKKQVSNLDGSSDIEKPRRGGRKSSLLEGGHGDPYHSGHYSFATEEDENKAAETFAPNLSPDQVLQNVEDGLFTLDECKDIMVCWNPGKKGVAKDLKQVRFSIRDILLTRQQLNNTVILTRRAAECVVDFCPDMLWRGTLLRVASEAGYGNKDVRTRMCLNGNYCDKATITKRIGSALGQKQQQSLTKMKKKEGKADDPSAEKIKGYARGEEQYYTTNCRDFGHYKEYFGHGSSHRATLNLRKAAKQKAMELDSEEVSESSGAENSLEKIDAGSESTQSMDEETGLADTAVLLGEDDDETIDDNMDAVSVQSDTALDDIDTD